MVILSRIYQGIISIKDTLSYRLGHYYRMKRLLPAQTAADRRLFMKVFQLFAGKSLRVFEWGAGYSTIFYSRYLVSIGADFEWHAIDNSPKWQEHVSSLVTQYRLDNRVHIYLSKFPAFWEIPGWSWEEKQVPEEVCRPEATEYVEYPKRLTGERGFDVVIVDGRFRRRCLHIAAEVLAPGGVVLLHDAQKSHYHSALGVYRFGRFFNTGRMLGAKVRTNTWLGTFDGNRLSDIETEIGARGKGIA